MQVLTDQEFTYRQSPAEQDGYGKFKALYGNTLVWNQLSPSKAFASSYSKTGLTFVSNDDGSVSISGTVNGTDYNFYVGGTVPVIQGHKYLVKGNSAHFGASYYSSLVAINEYNTGGVIATASATGNAVLYIRGNLTNGASINETIYPQIFDLTAMGLDSITVEQFTSLFSKPYYDYCQGAMLSFGGRNVKFNQQLHLLSGTYWVQNNASVVFADGVGTFTATGATFGCYLRSGYRFTKIGHKYLFSVNVTSSTSGNVNFGLQNVVSQATVNANVKTRLSAILEAIAENTTIICYKTQASEGDTLVVSDYIAIDLTEMFGAGNEPSAEGFKELFPNDYYEYTTGKYMNLGQPVSLKTVGFNLFDQDSVLTSVGFTKQSDGSFYIQYPSTAQYKVLFENKLKYSGQFFLVYKYKYINTTSQGCRFEIHYTDGSVDQLYAAGSNDFVEISYLSKANKVLDYISGTYGSNIETWWKDVCINFSDTERNGTYESYKENIIEMPLDEFPDGMDGINDARDEKNETGYAKRIWRVDLGSLYWTLNTEFRTSSLSSIIAKPSNNSQVANAICSKYTTTSVNGLADKNIGVTSGGGIRILDSAYSDVETFVNAMSGIYLYYGLATPLENYGVVDLGTLNWIYTNGMFQTSKSGISPLPSSDANVLCLKYSYRSTAGADKTITQTLSYFRVYDSSFTDADIFKQAMSGVYLLYEKENPQGLVYPPQSKDDYPFFKSYNGGTEQLLPENGSVPVTAPIFADMNYSSSAIEVTTYPNPEQGGETSGDGWYLVGEEATVNATPNEHYAFNNWVLDGEIVSTDPEYTFEVQDE